MPEESAPAAAESLKPAAPVATIAEIGKYDGQSVTLKGWLYNLRESGKLVFPIFRDGTGSIQGVAHVKSVTPEVFETLKHLTQESSVIVTGKVRADKRAPGGYELDVEDVQVVHRVPESDPYPWIFCRSGGTCGCARLASRRFCAFARRS
jgi:asparaginyl-tRNA synthetase